MIQYILILLIASAAQATEVKHDSDSLFCNDILSPSAQLKTVLESKKKSITVLVGAAKATEDMLAFVTMQTFTETNTDTSFQFDKKGRFNPELNTPENNSLLTVSLLQRQGKTANTAELSLGDWLHQRTPGSTHLLMLNIDDLSLRQQRELLKIYEVLPVDDAVHILLYTGNAENLAPQLRAPQISTIFTEEPEPAEFPSEVRGQQLRQVSNLILERAGTPLQANIAMETRMGTEAFVRDVVSLSKTLTSQPLEYFMMDTESTRVPDHARRAFVQKRGLTGTLDDGDILGRKPLEDWLSEIAAKPNSHEIVRLIVIYENDLTESERHAMDNWIDKLQEQEDAHQLRILVFSVLSNEKSRSSHSSGFIK